jgi:ABC-2 type transport system ATP-binding protein
MLRARAVDGAATIPSLITALEQDGLSVASATVARPSLDDVYLRYAGRSFEQADTEVDYETKEAAA